MSSTALVTGAAGFIGSHLVRRLASDGGRVVAVDVRAESPFSRDGGSPGEIRYERCDVRDAARLRGLLEGVNRVFHLASVHLEVGEDERVFREVNVAASRDLVDACVDAGVPGLIHTSSVGIYGDVKDPPAAEDAPRRPESPYERTKLAGEEAVRRRAAERGLDAVVLRPAWVYGPGCPRTRKLIRTLRAGRFLYFGRGDNLRHPVYVDDVLDAYVLAADRVGERAGRAYIVGGPRALELREMVNTFADAMGVRRPWIRIPKGAGWGLGLMAESLFSAVGREPPVSRRSLAFFDNDNAFDITAARCELGFEPRVELEEGVRRTLRAEGETPAVVGRAAAAGR